jgi:hypothetical protein
MIGFDENEKEKPGLQWNQQNPARKRLFSPVNWTET